MGSENYHEHNQQPGSPESLDISDDSAEEGEGSEILLNLPKTSGKHNKKSGKKKNATLRLKRQGEDMRLITSTHSPSRGV